MKKSGKLTQPACLNIIDRHKIYRSLDLINKGLDRIPENIGDYQDLMLVRLLCNDLRQLPESIGKLRNLVELYASYNHLIELPDSIVELSKLETLYLAYNSLLRLPDNIGNLESLETLILSHNNLKALPDNIGNLGSLVELDLSHNELTKLPDTMWLLTNLRHLYLCGNPLSDLSRLVDIPNLYHVGFNGVSLPPRYWCKLADWQPEWLLDEQNPQVRDMLISHFGYQQICTQLNIRSVDEWRDYDLLKIESVEQLYDSDGDLIPGSKPMALLKMVCPSTNEVHIRRVPPEIKSAEAAITWINCGLHPDKLLIQS